ncbi:hypoxanthine phosphoribosyltransferase [Armatimonadetes bacterium DC]|nr:hypoxanthine phosphoribosyltransferase [Armatimonadetes bacterium DC]
MDTQVVQKACVMAGAEIDWSRAFPEVEVFLTEEQIQEAVRRLGEQIARDYSPDSPPLLVGVLKGSLVFLADLMRAIPLPVSFDFVAISSYGAETQTSGQVRLLKDLDTQIQGRHVLVVEDILDTGLTLSYLLDLLRTRQPASLRVCTLLRKPDRQMVEVPVDYCAFTIPNYFVVGYGLDYDERYRNLPFIGILRTPVSE